MIRVMYISSINTCGICINERDVLWSGCRKDLMFRRFSVGAIANCPWSTLLIAVHQQSDILPKGAIPRRLFRLMQHKCTGRLPADGTRCYCLSGASKFHDLVQARLICVSCVYELFMHFSPLFPLAREASACECFWSEWALGRMCPSSILADSRWFGEASMCRSKSPS